MGWIILFIVIPVIYQLVKPKGPTVQKMSAFDAFLIQQYKKSQEQADKIPAYVPSAVNNTQCQNKSWTDNLYLGMIVSEQYDTNALRKEAMEVMGTTEIELDKMLEQYKLDTKKKRQKHN